MHSMHAEHGPHHEAVTHRKLDHIFSLAWPKIVKVTHRLCLLRGVSKHDPDLHAEDLAQIAGMAAWKRLLAIHRRAPLELCGHDHGPVVERLVRTGARFVTYSMFSAFRHRRVVRVLGVIDPITQREHAEDHAREAKMEYEAIRQNLHHPIDLEIFAAFERLGAHGEVSPADIHGEGFSPVQVSRFRKRVRALRQGL